MPFTRIIIASILSIFLLIGCATVDKKTEKPAKDLAKEGMEQFNKEKYKAANETFQKIKDWYPFSKYSILAELKLADSHYHLHNYDEAIMAYEEFEDLHPLNEAIPYVIYQKGLCYFDQIDTIDRDQKTTRKALSIFKRLESQHGGSSYTEKAASHIKKCMEKLANNEFYVALFYFKSKNYKAALNRFQKISVNYPDSGLNSRSLKYIGLCEKQLEKEKKEE